MTSDTTASGPLGSVTRDGEVVVLTYERDLTHPPEKVWRAITESEHLRDWFPVDIIGERAVGATLRLTFWPEALAQAGEEIEAAGMDRDDPTLLGEVLTWEPPRVFEFTWDSERLRFDLEPTETGTTLRVAIRTPAPAPRGYARTAAGYHMCFDALAAALDGEPTNFYDSTSAARLEEAYSALV